MREIFFFPSRAISTMGLHQFSLLIDGEFFLTTPTFTCRPNNEVFQQIMRTSRFYASPSEFVYGTLTPDMNPQIFVRLSGMSIFSHLWLRILSTCYSGVLWGPLFSNFKQGRSFPFTRARDSRTDWQVNTSSILIA